MKNLIVGAFSAIVAMSATGCIITSDGDDDPGPGVENAYITAEWSIKNLATDDNSLPCPPGINTAAVYSQAIDANNDPVGQPIIDLFTCADFSGRTAALDPDVYQSWVELTTGSGGSVYARSLSAIVDVVDNDKTFTTTILEDGGYFELSWDITRQGSPSTCAAAVANGVGVLSTEVANAENAVDDRFTCDDYYGVTGGLLSGTYTVNVAAIDAGGSPIGDSQNLINKVILDKNQVTDLGHLTIDVD